MGVGRGQATLTKQFDDNSFLGTLPDMTGSREIDSDGRLKATGSCCGYTVVQYCERVPDEDEETDSKL